MRDRAPAEHLRRACETALQPDSVGEPVGLRSSQTMPASMQWPGAPPKGHALGAHPPALRNSSELPSHLPSTPKSKQSQAPWPIPQSDKMQQDNSKMEGNRPTPTAGAWTLRLN
uniref:Uncharacterized protein n=1 Tax=Plectus sambesii TaxID=2011161 RepID=A0A914VT82_9BILA